MYDADAQYDAARQTNAEEQYQADYLPPEETNVENNCEEDDADGT